MLRCIIIFSTLLTIAVKVRAQCQRPYVDGNRSLMDDSGREIFSAGDTVRFKCSTGYVTARTSGSRSITCNGTHWSELGLQCEKKRCSPPGDLLHGRYLFEPDAGISFGATITAVCDHGYQLIGLPTRNCRETGWDGREPVCEAVMCPKPPGITNGVFEPEKEAYNFGEAVMYSCIQSHDLIGSSVISCSSDGTFGSPPECKRVSCNRPEIRNAIRVKGNSGPYKYHHFVEYICEKGYRMEGSGYLTCMENGWDPPPPNCTVITCLKPPLMNKGKFEPDMELYRYSQTVTYSCEEGFRLSGVSTVSCTDDGTFGTSFPQCQEITCESSSIPHAVFSGVSGSYGYGVAVNITCKDNYKIQGSNSLTCGKDGWIPPDTQCVEISCVVLQIDYADIVDRKTSYKYNTNIQYKCWKGYRMEGSDLLTCTKNGWNPPAPQCNIVTCSPPPAPSSGQFNPVKEEYKYKETITYSCNTLYRLTGASSISCTEDGTFQPPPQCEIVTCSPPPAPSSGQFNPVKEEYKYKETITYSCNTLYRLTGASSISCTEDGTFQPPPQCESILLPSLIGIGSLVFGGGVGFFFYKRHKKNQESKKVLKPENSSLVMLSSGSEGSALKSDD